MLQRQQYRTFTAALLAAVAGNHTRMQAMHNATNEPRYTTNKDGARFVTYIEPKFTLIVRYSPERKTWLNSWTWTSDQDADQETA